MTPIYEKYRSETPMYFHYATGSKNYEISLFGLKLMATTAVILCFERWYPKQNGVFRLKSNILTPKNFVLAALLALHRLFWHYQLRHFHFTGYCTQVRTSQLVSSNKNMWYKGV